MSKLRRTPALRLLGAFVLLVPLLAIATCGRTTTEPVMSRETFVQVVVALRRANLEGPSIEEFEARKAQILADAGVTDSLLVTYLRSQRNAKDLAELWELVNEQLSTEEDVGGEGDKERS